VNAPQQYVGLIFLSLILSGCIPFPTFEGEPYSDDVPNLKVGITTKKNILDLLGEPGATFSRESEFVYTGYQSEVVFIGPNVTLGKLHFLVLSFNEDDVLGDYFIKSASPDSHGCINTGWCAGHQNRVLRLADAEQDAKAKQFTVKRNQCGIYLYGRFIPTTAVTLNGKSTGRIFGKSVFQHFQVIPGTYELALVREPGVKKRWGEPKLPPPLVVDCIGDEVVFIEVNNIWRLSLKQQHDGDEGREQIRKRNLVIPGHMRKLPILD
jgi:hypothetical protein